MFENLLENQVVLVFVQLVALAVPLWGVVTLVTQSLKTRFGWEDNKAYDLSMMVGGLYGISVLGAYFYPPAAPYIASVLFLPTAIFGASGGYDLWSRFSNKT